MLQEVQPHATARTMPECQGTAHCTQKDLRQAGQAVGARALRCCSRRPSSSSRMMRAEQDGLGQ